MEYKNDELLNSVNLLKEFLNHFIKSYCTTSPERGEYIDLIAKLDAPIWLLTVWALAKLEPERKDNFDSFITNICKGVSLQDKGITPVEYNKMKFVLGAILSKICDSAK